MSGCESGGRTPPRGAATTASPWPPSAASRARDGGPLSDYDLVLVHDGRSLGAVRGDRAGGPAVVPDLGCRASGWTTASAPSTSAGPLPRPTCQPPSACSTWSRSPGTPRSSRGRGPPSPTTGGPTPASRLPQLVESLEAAARSGTATSRHLSSPTSRRPAAGLRDMTVLRALAAAWLADRPHGAVDAAYEQPAGRPRRRCTSSPAGAGTGSAGRTTTRSPRCWDTRRRRAAHHGGGAARTIAYALDGTVRRAVAVAAGAHACGSGRGGRS